MTPATTNATQASSGRLPGTMSDVLTKWLRGQVDDMLPAVVIRYDEGEGRATIRPIVMLGTTDGAKVSRAQIEDVPVYRMGGGGLLISVPLNPGDLGWLKATDRDLSLFKQHGIEDWPNTQRLHSFEDAMFFPDAMRDVVLGKSDALCIQTKDGTTGIFVEAGMITLRTPGNEMTMGVTGLRHNGINIGSTHSHIGPSSAPDGPISNTGTPIP